MCWKSCFTKARFPNTKKNDGPVVTGVTRVHIRGHLLQIFHVFTLFQLLYVLLLHIQKKYALVQLDWPWDKQLKAPSIITNGNANDKKSAIYRADLLFKKSYTGAFTRENILR